MKDCTEIRSQSVFKALQAEGALSVTMARYYNPAIGRFVSEDPLSRYSASLPPALRKIGWKFNGTLPAYAYVKNSPIRLVDPLGLLPYPCRSCDLDYFADMKWCEDRASWGLGGCLVATAACMYGAAREPRGIPLCAALGVACMLMVNNWENECFDWSEDKHLKCHNDKCRKPCEKTDKEWDRIRENLDRLDDLEEAETWFD
jgi:RHS repeat-associated protein